jgi:hypothetical protein
MELIGCYIITKCNLYKDLWGYFSWQSNNNTPGDCTLHKVSNASDYYCAICDTKISNICVIYFIDLTIGRLFRLKAPRRPTPKVDEIVRFLHSFPQFYRPNEITFVEEST